MEQPQPAKQLQQLLLAARQSLKEAQPARAASLLTVALQLDSCNALAFFLLGTARAALAQHSEAADAFHQATQLTANAAPGSQRHALHIAAADNLLLESERVLPADWIPALHDAPRLATLQRGVAEAVRQAAAGGGGQPVRVLVCSGLGVEAVMAAQAGAAAVTVYCEGNPLAARLAAQLAADNGCGGRVVVATSAAQLCQLSHGCRTRQQQEQHLEEQQQGQQPPAAYAVLILADALGSSINWQLLRRQLAAAAPLLAAAGGGGAGGAVVVVPRAVYVEGMLVHCPAAVALNEVDAEALQADAGGLDWRGANRLLPRASRSMRLASYQHTPLTASSTLLRIDLASLLPQKADASRTQAGAGAGAAAKAPAGAVAAAVAAAAVMDAPAAAEEAAAAAWLPVQAGGAADALCWWYEQLLVADGGGGGSSSSGAAGAAGGSPLLLSADPGGFAAAAAQLHPHVWQHLQYLDHRQLAAGQAVQARCRLTSAGVAAPMAAATSDLQELELADGGSSDRSSGGRQAGDDAPFSLHFDVLLSGSSSSSDVSSGSDAGSNATGRDSSSCASLLLLVQQAALAAAVPRYHTSMLNDAARTVAYREGIAAAMQQAAEQAVAAGSSEAPLVLEIGSGSGLLCMLACQAGAQRIVGCERMPQLQQVAAQLLAENSMAGRVSILPKHSKELTLAAAADPAAVPVCGAASSKPCGPGISKPIGCEGGGSSSNEARGLPAVPADLPRRADVLLHEIFGSDPFSEGVVATLAHAKQHLLRPGATLAPCQLHVVAAVAASASQHRLLRPPLSVCGDGGGNGIRTAGLRQLAPRKVDCQVSEAADLYLLTEPAVLLSLDFEAADLALEGSTTALLECLPSSRLLADWTAEQAAGMAAAVEQVAGEAAAASSFEDASGDGSGSDEQPSGLPPPAPQGASLYAVSWFEYEHPSGICGSTAPHMQRTEHWQQVLQPLEGPAAAAVLASMTSSSGDGGGSPAALLLKAGYRVDRLWYELVGIAAGAAAAASDGEGEA